MLNDTQSGGPNDAAPDATETDGKGGDLQFWLDFGFDATIMDGAIRAAMPNEAIGFTMTHEHDPDIFKGFVQDFGTPPSLILEGPLGGIWIYGVASQLAARKLMQSAPAGVRVMMAGERITLPTGHYLRPEKYMAKSVGELRMLDGLEEPDAPLPASPHNPLLQYSLLGSAEEFAAKAVAAKPLLGEVCLSGQATVWYAPPNAGKTLIGLHLALEAVDQGRIDPGNVYYINADDSSEGLATKMQLMDDAGIHTLVPGQKGFRASDLAKTLHQAAKEDQAKGVLVIIDTAKKFVSLMDKRDVAAFAEICRQFVLNGGTVLALGHTAKNGNADGNLRYAGTTDLLDDFDASFIITPLEDKSDGYERIVEFTNKKRRGNSPDRVAYAYANDPSISYVERLVSVRLVDDNEYAGVAARARQVSDAEAIEAITAAIADGFIKKMELASEAARRSGLSKRAVIRKIEQYTGTDPQQHKWTFQRKNHGAKVFALIAEPEG
jgi:hypothetical protein